MSGNPWRRREVIGDAVLYLGDCLEILPTLEKVDAVVTGHDYVIESHNEKSAGRQSKTRGGRFRRVGISSRRDNEVVSDGETVTSGAGRAIRRYAGGDAKGDAAPSNTVEGPGSIRRGERAIRSRDGEHGLPKAGGQDPLRPMRGDRGALRASQGRESPEQSLGQSRSALLAVPQPYAQNGVVGEVIIVTDPPYGIDIGSAAYVGGNKPIGSIGRKSSTVVHAKEYGKHDWDKVGLTHAQWHSMRSVSSKWVVWGGNHLADVLGKSQGTLVWDKKCRDWDDTFSDAEIAWTNLITRTKVFRHMWVGAFRDSEKGADVRAHHTQKPAELMKWCIGFAPHDASILDPFMGSGTTGVAAVQLGRKFIGIEIEEKYFDIAVERITNAQRQQSLLDPYDATTKSYEQVKLL